MGLICPHCGKRVLSENINIQRMAAVCSNCHTVFEFDPSPAKIKRRKVKQPSLITSSERDGHLTIAFRTNFRLDKNENFLSSGGLSLVFTFMTALLFSQSAPALLMLGFGLITLALYYWLALVAFNKTHIDISDEQITVSRQPIPNLLNPSNTIDLSGIQIIRYEETAVSKKNEYDTPRYNVWAEVVDGNRRLIVGDVVEDYAVFIAQRLNELLNLETPDVSRLLDDEETEDGQIPDAFVSRSESSRTR